MVHTRVLRDNTGKWFKVILSIPEEGPVLERAILTLAQKARASSKKRASVCEGLVKVFVEFFDEEVK